MAGGYFFCPARTLYPDTSGRGAPAGGMSMKNGRREALALWAAALLLLCGALRPAPAAQAAMAAGGEKLVALTFDDGPRRSTTAALLDGLSQRGVRATFFLVGSNVEGNEDLIARMEAEGHQVGIHSASHKMLTGLNDADFYREVGALRRQLEGLLGHGALLLRPPYGKVDRGVERRAGSPIILWSIDPEDWSDDDSARQTALITASARDGDIILLHDIYPSSVETALAVVDALLSDGFYFVTVEELFAARNIKLQNGRVYRSARS